MNIGVQTHLTAENQLERSCRTVASVMPAVIVGYSALIDPLINFDLAAGVEFAGVQVGDEGKTRTVTRIVMPAFLAISVLLAFVARPVVPNGLRTVALPALLLLVLAAVSSVWSRAPSATFTLAAYQAILFGSLLVCTAVSGDPPRIMRYVLAMFAIVVAVNLAAVLVRPPTPDGHAGIYTHKNTLGAAGGCAFLFSVFMLLRGNLYWRALACMTAVGALIVTDASTSKTALAMIVAAPLLAVTLYISSRVLAVGIVMAAVFVAAGAVSVFMLAGSIAGFDFADFMLIAYGDTTFTGRTDVWAFMLDHIQRSPLLGNGYRGFWSLGGGSPKHGSEVEFIRTIGSGHNGYLDITLDVGLIGLGLLVCYVIVSLRAAGRFALRPASHSLLYLSVIVFLMARNFMESVILWSPFFDNLCFVLVGFLACYPVRQEQVTIQRHPAVGGLQT